LAENLLFFDAEEQQKRAEEDSKIQKKEERERERKKRKREEDKLMLVEANKAKTRGKGARRFSATNRLGGCALCVKCIDYVLVIPLMEFPLVNTKQVVGRRSKIPQTCLFHPIPWERFEFFDAISQYVLYCIRNHYLGL
jgi:hypothetical protein